MINLPPTSAPTSSPLSFTTAASIPKNGNVALPGFVGIAPGKGVIRIAPVSVCHQVSTIGQRPPPTLSPAHIRRTPIDVFFANIEDIFHRRINSDQIPARGVENPLRFSGRAAGIKNVERMLAVDCDGWTMGIHVFELTMPPDVAAFLDVN